MDSGKTQTTTGFFYVFVLWNVYNEKLDEMVLFVCLI